MRVSKLLIYFLVLYLIQRERDYFNWHNNINFQTAKIKAQQKKSVQPLSFSLGACAAVWASLGHAAVPSTEAMFSLLRDCLSHTGCPPVFQACIRSELPRGPEPRTYPYIASLSLLRASLTEEPILGGMVLVWAVCGYWWECSWGPWLRCTACMDRAPCGSPYMVVGMPTPSIA